jgi:hypothetical protein
MSRYTWFSDTEIAGLNPKVPQMLDIARGVANVPFRLTSTVGGQHATNSTHYRGLAVDIGLGHLTEGFERDNQRWAMLKGLYAAGFKRIEICPLHLHVDIGEPPEYPSPICWIGTDT